MSFYYSSIGLGMFDNEDMPGLFSFYPDRVKPGEFKGKSYSFLSLPDNTELWRYCSSNYDYCVPFYRPRRKMMLLMENVDKSDTVASSCFIHTELCENDPIHMDIHLLNIFEHTEPDCTRPIETSVIGFTYEASVYKTEEQFKKINPGFAAESFICGEAAEDVYNTCHWVNGRISYIKRLHSDFGNADFFYYEIDCLGYTFCCVAEKDSALRTAEQGDIISTLLDMIAKID